jgi:hypothetical protein
LARFGSAFKEAISDIRSIAADIVWRVAAKGKMQILKEL